VWSPAAAAPASSGSTRIAFVLRVGGVGRIYTVRPDGTDLRLLSRLPQGFRGAGDSKPAWSPDGRFVAFARDERLNGTERVYLYVMRSDGTGLRRLTAAPPLRTSGTKRFVPTYDSMPAWSPDGLQIAFVRATAPAASLAFVYRTGRDGGRAAPLTQGYVFDVAPAWAPHGGKIVYSHEFPGRARRQLSHQYPQLIFRDTASIHGEAATDLYGTEVSWSPDGRRIALASFVDGNGKSCFARANLNRYLLGLEPSRPVGVTRCLPAGELYLANADGRTGRGRLTFSKADDRHPSWAPDGTELAFSSGYQDGRRHLPWLYLIGADGGTPRLVLAPKRGAVLDPAWSPTAID
jgi:Tol biopolymer transport system component